MYILDAMVVEFLVSTFELLRNENPNKVFGTLLVLAYFASVLIAVAVLLL